MIWAKTKDLRKYDQIAKVAKEIEGIDFINMEAGKYELEGENFFVIYDGELRADNTHEAHEVFIDIQIPLDNVEGFKFSLHNYRETSAVDEVKDVSFGYVERNESLCVVEPGEAIVFFPGEAHAPLMHVGGPKRIKKAIVKIKA